MNAVTIEQLQLTGQLLGEQPQCGEGIRLCPVAIALLELQQEKERLEQLVMRDPLTGLFNYRYLLGWKDEEGEHPGELERTIEKARRANTPFALLMLDVNRLKQINDTFGHTCGDEVLKAVARRIVEAVRKTDIVVRYAGDEFVVILEGAGDLEMVQSGVKRICENVNQSLSWEGEMIPLSVSVGVTRYFPEQFARKKPSSPTTTIIANLVREADQDMYRAKREHQT